VLNVIYRRQKPIEFNTEILYHFLFFFHYCSLARRRWEDNIKTDLQEVGGDCGDWMELAQDRDRWQALVWCGTFGFQKCGEFLD
jgi:hypothetical protein